MRGLVFLFTTLAVILAPLPALSAPAPNLGPLIEKAMQSPGKHVLNPARTVDEQARLRINKNYGKLPLRFEKNEGQTDEKVRFLSRGNGYSMYLTPTEAVMVLSKTTGGENTGPMTPGNFKETPDDRKMESSAIRMKLIGSNPDPRIYGQDEQITKSNYLIGNDPSKWKTGIANFGRIKYEEVYPGIDLVFYGNQQKLEYDFIVKPGADPGIINFEFEGEDSIAVDWDGNLRLETAIGEIVERAPVVYQNTGGKRNPVDGKYILANNRVSFELSHYDREQKLIIDPVLEYSTFLGGSGPDQDRGLSIAVDGTGNAYVAGLTYAPDFPTTSGAPDNSFGGTLEGFVSKLNPDGTTLSYSTFLGGSDQDVALSLALDALGNAYVVGYTSSNDFPTTPGAYQSPILGGPSDVFIAKINPTGTALVYSALLGGSDFDYGAAITVDALDNAYVTGHTRSSNFPTTPGAIQNTIIGAGSMVFVTKLNAAGTGLEYSTLLGGETPDTATSIVVDASGNAYVTGYTGSFTFPTTAGAFDTSLNGGFDCFVSKLNATGTALIYSTYLGGSLPDNPNAMAIDASGNAYITGFTNSNDFPTTTGAFDETFNAANDAFVTKLNASGTALDYSTYIGGAQVDVSESIAVDGSGNAYITGHTGSNDFPVTQGALDILFGGGFGDVFVTKINTTGTGLHFSTYLGESEQDTAFAITLDASGNGYVTGRTRSSNFPTTPGVFQSIYAGGNGDAFVSKINFAIPNSVQRNDFDGDGDSDLLL